MAKKPYPLVSKKVRGLTIDQAYEIQAEFVKLREAKGECQSNLLPRNRPERIFTKLFTLPKILVIVSVQKPTGPVVAY